VRPEIGYTFANGLRTTLRQDPNIIMVGEIRDSETANLAVQAALTGHLVLSTIHTNNSIGIVPRLLDMGVEPYLIPPVLILGMAQRLVRTLCPGRRQKSAGRGQHEEMLEKSLPTCRRVLKKLPRSTRGGIGSTHARVPDGHPGPRCVL
jgi:general secretion pathway protein E